MDKFVFRCSKKTLLIYAAIVWMFAGGDGDETRL